MTVYLAGGRTPALLISIMRDLTKLREFLQALGVAAPRMVARLRALDWARIRSGTCLLTMALCLSGCTSVGYYAQSIGGHVRILQSARPIEDWLLDPAVSPTLKARLERARAIRTFGSRELGLPDNRSYRAFAELRRPYVLWNVTAAPALSLQLQRWCFPIAGCVAYRGYYDRNDAEAFAADLRREGWDVQVAGIRAYSTLGWTPDPLLSTFLDLGEVELARLIFHELSHQLLYLPGDSTFNESFATVFEDEGVRRWVKYRGDPALQEDWQRVERRRQAFLDILRRYRQSLQEVYASELPGMEMRAAKNTILAAMRREYLVQKMDQASALYAFDGYDRFFAGELNNATLAAVATYTQMRPAFAKLLQEHDGDLSNFVAAARELAAMERTAREARLQRLGYEVGGNKRAP